MIKHRIRPGLAYKESWMQENGLNKLRTIVTEVSSFVGIIFNQSSETSGCKDKKD